MAKLDIQGMINNPNAKTIISFPGGTQVVGFMQNDLPLSANNEFNNPLENQSQVAANNLAQVGQSIAPIRAGLNKLGIGQVSFKNPAQTALFWTGSQSPTLNIQLAFVALKESDDIRTDVENLYRAVMPTFTNKGFTMQAPLGYIPTGGGSATGTFSVKIGTWLFARNLVMTNVDFSFSIETIASGAPLAAEGSIQCRPFRSISFKEFQSWLRGSATGTNTP